MPWIDSFSQLASRKVVAVLHTPWTTDATGFSTCRTYVELEGLGHYYPCAPPSLHHSC